MGADPETFKEQLSASPQFVSSTLYTGKENVTKILQEVLKMTPQKDITSPDDIKYQSTNSPRFVSSQGSDKES